MEKLQQKKQVSVALPLGLVFFAYFMSSFLRLSTVITMPILQEELHISAATVSFISSVLYITYAIMQILGGALCLKLGALFVVGSGFAISAVSTYLFSIGTNPIHIMIGRILMGIGVGPTFVAVVSILQENYSGKKYAELLGVAFMCSNTGSLTSSAPLQLIVNKYGISKLFRFLTFVLLACAALTFFCSRFYSNKQTSAKEIGLGRQIVTAAKMIVSDKVLIGCLFIWVTFNPLLGVYQSLWCVKWTSCAFSVMPQLHAYSGTVLGLGIVLGCVLSEHIRNQNKPRLKMVKGYSIIQFFTFISLAIVKIVSDSFPLLLLSLAVDLIYGFALGALCIQVSTFIRDYSDVKYNAMIMGIINCINNMIATGYMSLSGILIDGFLLRQSLNLAFASTFGLLEIINVVVIAAGLILIIRNAKESRQVTDF